MLLIQVGEVGIDVSGSFSYSVYPKMSVEGSLTQPSLSKFNLNANWQCAVPILSIKHCVSLNNRWSGSSRTHPWYRLRYTRIETCGWFCLPRVVVIIL